MKPLLRILFCAFVVLGAGCATKPAAPSTSPVAGPVQVPKPTPLLLISIDAYRADYINRGFNPTLQALATTGVHADSMQPSFPSLTFPNHYAIVTGMIPDHNGIVNNTMSDPSLGKFSLSDDKAASNGVWWEEATPIWETADVHGLRTASMFWPGSGANIQGMHPDYWKPYDGKVTPDQRVDQVLAWLDLPPDQRPSFITLYFDDVDHAGHKHGPDSPEVNQSLRDVDAAMARLVDGLRQRGIFDKINIIVLADHGMANVPLENNILIDKLIPLKNVETVGLGELAGFNPLPKRDFNAIEAQLEKPQAHMQCWDKTRIPERFHYGSNSRIPQLVCLANVGWRITTEDYLAKHKGTISIGEHGYDNTDPLMQALFIAHGPAFREGVRFHSFPNVDVYPLMAQLLGIPPEFNDGNLSDVVDMLKPAAQPAQP